MWCVNAASVHMCVHNQWNDRSTPGDMYVSVNVMNGSVVQEHMQHLCEQSQLI